MNNFKILENKKVLFVEDDDIVRESTLDALALFFNNIIVAKDGKEAMDLLSNDFDIVILDLMLPHHNGFDIAKQIRKKSSKTLIFMLSCHTQTDNLREAMRLGMIDFIPKPLKFEDLKNVLAQCTQRFAEEQLVSFGEIFLYDKQKKVVIKNTQIINLTKNEILFLELILVNKNNFIPYELISIELYNSQNTHLNVASIKNMLLRLRKKLGIPLVENASGMGYRVL